VEAFNSGLDQAKVFLESRVNDLQERIEPGAGPGVSSFVPNPGSRRIFVVHGHDHGHKETVARFLGSLELEPIILHEQADQGRTIIEKFEAHATNVQCAVVILTADDIAASKRQNREGPAARLRILSL
jgi:predicted nucleotide-binding protein